MEYYVYKHIRLKDGSIFYIGKGKGDRMYSADKRNEYWKRIVKKDGGFTAQLIKDNITDKEALELEMNIIKEIGMENLTNMTEGGNGGDTRKGFSQDEYDKWIKHKSEAQSGKTGWWNGKKRPEHSKKIKELVNIGKYKNNGKGVNYKRTDKWKQNQSEAAKKRIRPLLKCEICGMEMTTNMGRHQKGKNCKLK
jgi:hypothetical protein